MTMYSQSNVLTGPAQHKRVREFLEAHPEEIDGRQRSWQMFCEAEPEWQGASELQFVGEAGSCMFWHAMLPHGASFNASDRPRLATIARWRFPLPGVPPTIEMVSRSRSACCCQSAVAEQRCVAA